MSFVNKNIVNAREKCVEEMMDGLAAAYKGLLHIHEKYPKVAFSNFIPPGKVSLLSGGGAGHEPFCAGYVGKGMLSAAVSGSVFAAPPSSQIFEAIQQLSAYNNGAGILVIIPNYTGDRLNFGLAVEKALKVGVKVDSVIVGEDCAHQNAKSDFAGRRGLCGLVLIFKIAGAMSAEGKSLEEIVWMAKKAVTVMSTIGICLSPCILPDGTPSFTLAESEIALGVGVHGETGIGKFELCSAKDIVSLMLEKIKESLSLKNGDEVVVLVNNLGSTTEMEQWIVVREVTIQLSGDGIKILRIFCGHLMTSLGMSGVQICILKCKIEDETFDVLKWVDADTNAPAWPANGLLTLSHLHTSGVKKLSHKTVPYIDLKVEMDKRWKLPKIDKNGEKLIFTCIQDAMQALIKEETKINLLDTECGDGDCGTTLRRGAESILSVLDSLPLDCPGALMPCLAAACEPHMAGTAGSIYCLLLTTCSPPLADIKPQENEDSWLLWAEAWGKAWRCGLEGIIKYSGARVGDRTMIDVLEPACTKYQLSAKKSIKDLMVALESTLEAAEKGCAATGKMIPSISDLE
ncbi:PTS-dependent dihydroxyacetone kinase 1, dihydroxyacetone-binding subunit DhaK-like isoform X2 [Ischnura elegans]|uniref:PTS-dependent dihydroxyacetone kinase 1, dihydroxyacetone-binding subunit DhaK-like isoform X2 n=1 Tax=Ischnura elegans TaxID=197161 RepID=UPI001ED8A37B|nr:PTS-dependent dihydroxyacetone kinase 1, dihydroxyacetone-binding subunit DhaK-like isoform X2 [Ischnura elegans]